MTIFTPYQNSPPTPDYSRSTREIDVGRANRTGEVALGGLSDILSLGVKAVDDINKDAIDKELRGGIRNEIQDSINEGNSLLSATTTTPSTTVGGAAGVAPGSPDNVPGPVQSADRRMGILAQANRMGKLEDVNFFTNIQNIAQGTVSKYPGYEGYIHERVAHWLQVDPGRNVRSAVQSSLSQLMAKANSAEEKWTNDVEKWFPILGADGVRKALSTKDPEGRNQIRAFVAEIMHSKYTQDRLKDDFQLRLTRNQVQEADTESALNVIAAQQFGDLMTRVRFTANGFSMTGEELQRKLAQMRQTGDTDPNFMKAAGLMLGQIQEEWTKRFDIITNGREFTGPDGKSTSFTFTDSNGRPQTFASLMRNSTKINQISEFHQNNLASMIRNVGAKRLDLATAQMSWAEGIKANATVKALSIPTIQALAGVEGALGSAGSTVINTMMQQDNWKSLVQSSAQLLQMYGVTTSFGGPSATRSREIAGGATGLNQGASLLERANPGRQPTPAENRAIINTATFGVNQREDEGIARNWAEHISQGGTTDFLLRMNPARQFDAWAMISSPTTAARIKELSQNDPKVWERYDRFVQTTFQRLFNTYIDDVNRSSQFNQRLNISFNENTGRIDYSDPRATVRGSNPRSTGIGFEPIDRLNTGLTILKEHFKHTGEKFDEQTLKKYGIDLKQRYEMPWLNSVMDSMQRTLNEQRSPRIFDRNRTGGVDDTLPPGATPNQGPPLSFSEVDANQRVREGFRDVGRALLPDTITLPDGTVTSRAPFNAYDAQTEEELRGRAQELQRQREEGIPANARETMSRLTPFENPNRPGRPVGEGGGGGVGINQREEVSQAAIRLQDGTILKGPSHFDIINRNQNIKLDKAVDGFVTSSGRFVNRKEALDIANSLRQIQRDSRSNRIGDLLSEDIANNELPTKPTRRRRRTN